MHAASFRPPSRIMGCLDIALLLYSWVTIFFVHSCFRAMDVADKASLASKRVSNIIETMTFNVYRYISRYVKVC